MSNQQRPIIHMPATDADVDQVIRASENFFLHELDCRDGTPVPKELQEDVLDFIRTNMQPIRTFVGVPVYVRSGYRHPRYNAAIGGAKRSFHLYGHVDSEGVHADSKKEGRRPGFAVDLAAQGVEPVHLYAAIRGLMRLGIVEEGGMGLYPWGVHYDNRGVFTPF